ncbi:hypothetical protein EDC04DRAFT_2929881, partial [Pisolithus marmoratus]
EGLLTFIFDIFSFLLLPRSPETAHFLSSEERRYVVSIIKSSRAISDDDSNDAFSWMEVLRAIHSPHVFMICVVEFFDSASIFIPLLCHMADPGTVLYGLTFFEPTIVAGPGTQAIGCSSRVFPLSSLYFWVGMKCLRCYMLLIASVLPTHRLLIYSVTVHMLMLQPLSPNSAPARIQRASSIAFAFVATISGGILAAWLLGSLSPAPHYTAVTIIFITMSIGQVVFAALNLLHLLQQNHAKADTRLSMAKSGSSQRMGFDENHGRKTVG